MDLITIARAVSALASVGGIYGIACGHAALRLERNIKRLTAQHGLPMPRLRPDTIPVLIINHILLFVNMAAAYHLWSRT